MSQPNLSRISILLGAVALSALAGPAAFAEEAPATPVLAALDGSNPNFTEWSLIQLTAADVASAKGGAGVKVAVLDGLTDCRHKDLTGRCSNNQIPGGTYRYYGNHGTHTAGIVAGSQYGIATSATIVNYAVFDDTKYVATGAKLTNAWTSAYNSGARISSMSFGCAKMALCFSASEVTAMAAASRPMLYVKAAGNDGAQLVREAISVSSATANAAMNRTLLVGSVDASGNLSSFSNTPGDNCLLASGTTVCSETLKWKNHFLVAPGQAIYSTMPANGYAYMSGTSMATPVVAGVAALLQQRWPTLKNSPENLAKILLTTATDLGTPGVDAVYGYGLLNAAAAFRANGSVALQSPTGTTTILSGATTTTTSQLSDVGRALSSVTVYDQYGRDFTLGETNALRIEPNVIAVRQFLGRRQLASIAQEDWTAGFFANEPRAHGFAMFGSAAEAPGSLLALDRSTRMGVDMPFKGGLAQFRLTGAGDARQDFAHDPAMRPLSYFASTGLLRGALIGNAAIALPGRARLMVYGLATTGALNARFDGNPLELRLTERGFAPRAALTGDPVVRRQSGFGVGYWKQAGQHTVIGFNASAMVQRGGYYSLTSNLADFQRPTRLFNFGAAAIRRRGDWELSLSGELTHLRMQSGDAAITFTPAMLASAEIGLRKNHVAFGHGALRDSFALGLTIPPRAISGSLRVNYLRPTADGMDREAATLLAPIATLGREPVRIEAAYRLGAGAKWSLSLSGGANLERVPGLAAGEGMVTLRFGI